MKTEVVKFSCISTLVLTLIFGTLIASPEDNGFKVIRSDANSLIVSYKPIVDRWDTIVTADGYMTMLPVIKGSFNKSRKPGYPSLIAVNAVITVPDEKGFTLNSINIIGYHQIKGWMTPYPELNPYSWKASEKFVTESSTYATYPLPENPTLVYTGIARDRHIATLELIVARFNSSNQSIEIPNEIIFEVRFKNDYIKINNQPDNSPAFSLNHDETKNWRIEPTYNLIKDKKHSNDKTLGISGGNWIKISINKEGIYSIDASSISSLGFNIPKDQVGTIKIFGNGGMQLSETVTDASKNILNEQPIIVKTNGNGDLSSIIFYALGPQGFAYNGSSFLSWFNHYSDKSYYFLTWGGDPGKRVALQLSYSGQITNNPQTYTERILFKEELGCAFMGGSGRIWFGGSIFPRAFNNNLNNLDRNSDIYYKISFAQRASEEGEFTASESGNKLGSVTIQPNTNVSYLDSRSATMTGKIKGSSLGQDNRSILNLTYTNPKMSAASPYFNWYEIHYRRSLIPVDNQITFWTDPNHSAGTEYSINNFSGEIVGFDVTDPAKPFQIKNESVTGGMFVFRVKADSNQPKKYAVASSFLKPELASTTFGNLRENFANSEVIVITHPQLLTSAEKYQALRKEHNPTIVRTDHIYNEFGSGIPDPTAIRDFIAFALANWQIKPKYVVLWGDGHYDFKNISTKAVNFIPPYESDEQSDAYNATESFTSDDFFAKARGNDPLIDIMIGRMPIGSDEEGIWMAKKLEIYDKSSSDDYWRTMITLVADDGLTTNGGTDRNTHTSQSEKLGTYVIPEYMQLRKIYLPEYPSENIPNGRRKPRVTEDIVSYVNNAGTLTLNYVGHGNPRVWAHEEVFDRDKTIAQLNNLNKLFYNTAATCDFARFDMTDTRSGAEALLLAKKGGSIGEFSSTRVVYSYDNAMINEEFHARLFDRVGPTKRYQDMGEIMFNVKQRKYNSNDIKYNLFGDPLTRLLLPYYIVRVDSINGRYTRIPGDTIKLKALSQVSVVASIISPVDSSVVKTFNGTSTLMMFDADYSVDVLDVDIPPTTHTIRKTGGALSRGSFAVINGNINANFYLPEDISFINGPGRLYIYAKSNDSLYANGVLRKFKLLGVDSITFIPTKPSLDIYLDTTTFISGGYVSENPILIVRAKDDYGINTTGSGIGHRMEAWIDDNSEAIDLTAKAQALSGNSGIVEARQTLFNIKPGIHKVRARVWNVFNEYKTAETYFRVAGAGLLITDINCVPNPARTNTVIKFGHNQNQPFDVKLTIYDITGKLVRKMDMNVSSVHTSEIDWDGLDMNNTQVSSGQYIIYLEAKASGETANATTGLNIIR